EEQALLVESAPLARARRSPIRGERCRGGQPAHLQPRLAPPATSYRQRRPPSSSAKCLFATPDSMYLRGTSKSRVARTQFETASQPRPTTPARCGGRKARRQVRQ